MNGIYCGNNALEPKLITGELNLGTKYKCLQKGLGIGKAKFSFTDHQNNIKFYLKIFGLSFLLISALLYYIRPNLLLKYNKKQIKKNIIWWKLVFLSILKSLFITLLVYLFVFIK